MSNTWPLNSDYSYWIYQQLEPDDRIITGNYKRIHEVKKQIVMPNPSPDYRTQQEIEAAEDEYLKSHGIC